MSLIKKISATHYAKIVPAAIGHTSSLEDRMSQAESILNVAKDSDEYGEFLSIDERMEHTEGRVSSATTNIQDNTDAISNVDINRLRDNGIVGGNGVIPEDVNRYFELKVVQNPDSSLVLDISKGSAFINGQHVVANASQSVSIAPDQFDNERIDFVVLNLAGQAIVISGPEDGSEPEIPTNVIPLARIHVEPALGKIAKYDLNVTVDARNLINSINRLFYVKEEHIPVNETTPIQLEIDGFLQPEVNYVFDYEIGKLTVNKITISDDPIARQDERTFEVSHFPMFQGRIFDETAVSINATSVNTDKKITDVRGVFLASDSERTGVNYYAGGGSFFDQTITLGTPLPNPNEEVIVDYYSGETVTLDKNALYKAEPITGGWSVHGSYTNIYGNPSYGRDSKYYIHEVYESGTKLVYVDTLADCNTTDGSWTDADTGYLYVNPNSDSDPSNSITIDCVKVDSNYSKEIELDNKTVNISDGSTTVIDDWKIKLDDYENAGMIQVKSLAFEDDLTVVQSTYKYLKSVDMVAGETIFVEDISNGNRWEAVAETLTGLDPDYSARITINDANKTVDAVTVDNYREDGNVVTENLRTWKYIDYNNGDASWGSNSSLSKANYIKKINKVVIPAEIADEAAGVGPYTLEGETNRSTFSFGHLPKSGFVVSAEVDRKEMVAEALSAGPLESDKGDNLLRWWFQKKPFDDDSLVIVYGTLTLDPTVYAVDYEVIPTVSVVSSTSQKVITIADYDVDTGTVLTVHDTSTGNFWDCKCYDVTGGEAKIRLESIDDLDGTGVSLRESTDSLDYSESGGNVLLSNIIVYKSFLTISKNNVVGVPESGSVNATYHYEIKNKDAVLGQDFTVNTDTGLIDFGTVPPAGHVILRYNYDESKGVVNELAESVTVTPDKLFKFPTDTRGVNFDKDYVVYWSEGNPAVELNQAVDVFDTDPDVAKSQYYLDKLLGQITFGSAPGTDVRVDYIYEVEKSTFHEVASSENKTHADSESTAGNIFSFHYIPIKGTEKVSVDGRDVDYFVESKSYGEICGPGNTSDTSTSDDFNPTTFAPNSLPKTPGLTFAKTLELYTGSSLPQDDLSVVSSTNEEKVLSHTSFVDGETIAIIDKETENKWEAVVAGGQITISVANLTEGNKHYVTYIEGSGHILSENLVLIQNAVLCTQVAEGVTPTTAEEYSVDYETGGITFGIEPATIPIANYVYQPQQDNQYCIHDNGTIEFGAAPPTKPNLDYWFFKEMPVLSYDPVTAEVYIKSTEETLTAGPQAPYTDNVYTGQSETELWKVNLPLTFMEGTAVVETYEFDLSGNEIVTEWTKYTPVGTFDWSNPPVIPDGEYYIEEDLGSPYAGNILFGEMVSVGTNTRAVVNTTRYMPTPFERIVADFDFAPENAYQVDYRFGLVTFGNEVLEDYQPLATYDYPYPPVGGASPMTLSIRYTKQYAIENQVTFVGEPPTGVADGTSTEFYIGELLTVSSAEGDVVLETDIETNMNRKVTLKNLSPQIDIGDVVTVWHDDSGLTWKSRALADNEVVVDDNSIVLIENEAQTSTDELTVTVTNPIGRVVGVWLAADSDRTGTNYWIGEKASFSGSTITLAQELPEANAALVIDYGQTLDDYSLINSDNITVFRSAIPVDAASPLEISVQPDGYPEVSPQVENTDFTFNYIDGIITFNQVRVVNEEDTVSTGNVTADITPLVTENGITGVWKKNDFADPGNPTEAEKAGLTNYYLSYNYSNGEINVDITQPGGLENGDDVYIDYLYQNPPRANSIVRASYTPTKVVISDKRDMPVNWLELRDARIATENNWDGNRSIDPDGRHFHTIGDRIDSIENALGEDLAKEEGRTVEKRLDVLEGSLGVERVDIGQDKDSYLSDPDTYDKENHTSVDNTERDTATVDARLKLVETAIGNTDYTNKSEVESDNKNHLDGRITVEERLDHLEGIIRNCRVPQELTKPLLDIIDSADYQDGYTSTKQIDVGTNESGWPGTSLATDAASALTTAFPGYGTGVSFDGDKFTISASRDMIKIDERFLGEKMGFDENNSQADRTESPVVSHTSPMFNTSSMAFSVGIKNYNGGVNYSEEAYGVSDFWYEYDVRIKVYNGTSAAWEYLKYNPAEVSGDRYGMSQGTTVVAFGGDDKGKPGSSDTYGQTYSDATQLSQIDDSKGYYIELVARNGETISIGKHGQIMSEAVIQGDATYAARTIDFGGVDIIGEDISITGKEVVEPIQVNYIQADYGKTEFTIGNVPASENAINVRLIAIERGLEDLRTTPLKTGEVYETALGGSNNTITLPSLPAHSTLVKGDPTPEWDKYLIIEDVDTGQRLTRDDGTGEAQATISSVTGTGEISDPYIITVTPATDTAGSKNLRVHYQLTYELSELPDLANIKREIQTMIDDVEMTTWMHYHQINDAQNTRTLTIESEDATEHNEPAHIELNTTQNPDTGSSSVDTKTQNLDIDVSNKMTIDVGHTAGGTDHDLEIEVADTFQVHSDDQIIHNADVEHEINTPQLDINVSDDMHTEVTDRYDLVSHNIVDVTADNEIELNTPQLDINVSDDMHTEVTDEYTVVSHDRIDMTGDTEIELKTPLLDIDVSNNMTLDVLNDMTVNVSDELVVHSSDRIEINGDTEVEIKTPLLDIDVSNDVTMDVLSNMTVNVTDVMNLNSSNQILLDADNELQIDTPLLDINVPGMMEIDVTGAGNDLTINVADLARLHSSNKVEIDGDVEVQIDTPLLDINVTDEFNLLANDDIIMQANDDVTITADDVLTLHAGTTSTELVMNDQDVTLTLPSNTSTYTINIGSAPDYGNMEIFGNLTVKGDMTVVDSATSYDIDQLILGDLSQYGLGTSDEIYLYGYVTMKSQNIVIDVDAGAGKFDLNTITEIEMSTPLMDIDATNQMTVNTPDLDITVTDDMDVTVSDTLTLHSDDQIIENADVEHEINTPLLDMNSTTLDIDGVTMTAHFTNTTLDASNKMSILGDTEIQLDTPLLDVNASTQMTLNTPLYDLVATTLDIDGTTMNVDFTTMTHHATGTMTLDADTELHVSTPNFDVDSTLLDIDGTTLDALFTNVTVHATNKITLDGDAEVQIDTPLLDLNPSTSMTVNTATLDLNATTLDADGTNADFSYTNTITLDGDVEVQVDTPLFDINATTLTANGTNATINYTNKITLDGDAEVQVDTPIFDVNAATQMTLDTSNLDVNVSGPMTIDVTGSGNDLTVTVQDIARFYAINRVEIDGDNEVQIDTPILDLNATTVDANGTNATLHYTNKITLDGDAEVQIDTPLLDLNPATSMTVNTPTLDLNATTVDADGTNATFNYTNKITIDGDVEVQVDTPLFDVNASTQMTLDTPNFIVTGDTELVGDLTVRGNMNVVDTGVYTVDTLNFGDATQYNTALRDKINMYGDVLVKTRSFNIDADGTSGIIDMDATTEIELTAPTIDIDATTAVTVNTANMTVTGNLNMSEYLYHAGDTNTYLRFANDQLDLFAGGVSILSVSEGTDPDVINIGPSNSGADINLNGMMYVDGSSTYVGIGTTQPSEALEIDGNLLVSGTIYGAVVSTGLSSEVDMTFTIDSNNNQADRKFTFQHDSGADLMTLDESSNMALLNGGVFTLKSGGSISVENASTTNSILLSNVGASGTSTLKVGNQVWIEEDGGVGIGTADPGANKLDVNGTSNFRDNMYLAAGKNLYLDGGSNTYIKQNAADVIGFYAGGSKKAEITSGSSYGAGVIRAFSSGDLIGLTLDSNTRKWDIVSLVSTTPDRFAIRDSTVGAERLVIDASGEVGINKSTPGSILHLKEATGGTGANSLRLEEEGAGTEYWGIGVNNNGDLAFFDGATQRITFEDGGFVGINTANPAYRVDINLDGANERFHIRDGGVSRFYVTDAGVVQWGSSAANGALSWDTNLATVGGLSGNALALKAGGSEAIRIKTDGNVGINTTNPNYTLEVNGTTQTDNLRIGAVTALEYIQDTIGDMVDSNTENGIAVTYNDTSGKLNFDVGDFMITLGTDLTGNVTITNLGNATLNATVVDDSHNHSNTTLSDIAWSKVSGKPDPQLILAGDASGNCTFTDLGSATLTVAIGKDNHEHSKLHYSGSSSIALSASSTGRVTASNGVWIKDTTTSTDGWLGFGNNGVVSMTGKNNDLLEINSPYVCGNSVTHVFGTNNFSAADARLASSRNGVSYTAHPYGFYAGSVYFTDYGYDTYVYGYMGWINDGYNSRIKLSTRHRDFTENTSTVDYESECSLEIDPDTVDIENGSLNVRNGSLSVNGYAFFGGSGSGGDCEGDFYVNGTLDVDTDGEEICDFRSNDIRGYILLADDDTTTYLVAEGSGLSLGFNASKHNDNLNIDNSGNVGIGTSNPGARLQVYETAADISVNVHVDSDNTDDIPSFVLSKNHNDGSGRVGTIANERLGHIAFQGVGQYQDLKTAAQIRGYQDSGTSETAPPGKIVFATNDGLDAGGEGLVEHMFIDKNGNVGIGRTTTWGDPACKLTIDGNDSIRLKGDGDAGSLGTMYFGDSNYVYIKETSDDNLRINAVGIGGDSTLRMDSDFIRMNGNIGINTASTYSSPACALSIYNDDALRVGVGSAGGAIYFGNGSDAYLKLDTDNDLKIYALEDITLDADDDITLDAADKTYIMSNNFSSPTQLKFGTGKYQVQNIESPFNLITEYGMMQICTTTFFQGFQNTGTDGYPFLRHAYGGNKYYIQSILGQGDGVSCTSGGMFIGGWGTGNTSSIDLDRTYVTITSKTGAGNINNVCSLLQYNGVTVATVSDARLKEKIESIESDSALEKISQLRGVYFEWKDKERGEGRRIGFIAQEAEEIIPECTDQFDRKESDTEEPYKLVHYEQVVPLLTEAVKEVDKKHKDKIEALEAENAEYKAKLEAIEQRLLALES